MSTKKPFFSILIPTYNQAKYLGAALDSVLSQSFSNWEAIIVNDGSTDDTCQVIDAYCLKDRRFHALHKINGGAGSALNAGLKMAVGEWVCWLSSDDLFEPYKLQTHLEWIEKTPECSFFFTHFRELHEKTGKLIDSDHWRPLPEKKFQVIEMLRSNYIAGNSICVSRVAWEKVGIFNEALRYGQDYDMWLRLLTEHPATYIPIRTCITRIHAHQDSQCFPQAMFYDSAKAAIQFLNLHALADAFPVIDLSDPKNVLDVVDKSLTVAEDRRAFVYALGSHPLLMLRIMELLQDNPQAILQNGREAIRLRILKSKYLNQYQEFSFIWKVAYAILKLELSSHISAIEPADTAEATFHRSNAFRGQASNRLALKQWLERFESRQVGRETIKSWSPSKNILLIDYQNAIAANYITSQQSFMLATWLQHFGNNVVAVKFCEYEANEIIYKNGILIIALQNASEIDSLLFDLGIFDIAIVLNTNIRPKSYPLCKLVLPLSSNLGVFDDLSKLKPKCMRVARVKAYGMLYGCKDGIRLLSQPFLALRFFIRLCYEIIMHKFVIICRNFIRIFFDVSS
ncbi:MAG: glycosyltransferase family 2 protein [Candidatus Methylumidiphilus sp.]